MRLRTACGLAGVLFLVALLAQGALRSGYDPVYQPGSALSLGENGWIQITNFIVCGLLLAVFGTGLRRCTGSIAGAALTVIGGVTLALAGVFSMDPMRGFPPGTPAGTPSTFTWEHQVHDMAGALTFTSLPLACLVLAFRLPGWWRVYLLVNGVAGLVLFVWYGTAYEADAPYAGLVQRVAITVDLTWPAALALLRPVLPVAHGRRSGGMPPSVPGGGVPPSAPRY
ncbi:DUF998 domain-containing protein [Nonomuraea rhizosphaerae]|uniref:DUF998 domain-containing protein n=1 Tax=Nonomuraea rhizosphaerae TaxID=2665663 RepID=UPI001C5DB21F|nr:DUF998 domain-containing protein [Nonomuraea rhizosphaerae]